VVLLQFAAMLLTTGCATTSATLDPASVTAKHVDDFTSGSMDAKQAWDLTVAAVNAGDWKSALATLEQLRQQPGLLPGQIQAANETLAAIRKSMNSQPAN